MKIFVGFLLGVLAVFLLGAASVIQEHKVHIDGEISNKADFYQATFSGITSEGSCYLAITNTRTGTAEIVKITKNLDNYFEDTAFQRAKEGRVQTSALLP
jgi:hypothetical protein